MSRTNMTNSAHRCKFAGNNDLEGWGANWWITLAVGVQSRAGNPGLKGQ